MITLHCKLTFKNDRDKEKLMDLMRRFSSCYRYAYNRLLEGHKRKDLKKHLQKMFNLNSRYCDDAISKAQGLIDSCMERGQNPEKVIFGGRRLFELLKKKHLNGEDREKLKQKWEERRKGYLYSRGNKTKKGNLNTRVEFDGESLVLRINTGKREWIKANVVRTVTRVNDRWTKFVESLLNAEKTKAYFPYSIEIRVIDGNVYGFISYEEDLPEIPTITRDNGVIGIDINASPFHIATVTVKPDGNIEKAEKIPLHSLLNKTKNQREYLSWHIAHEITDIAKEQSKAIAIEKLQNLPKGNRGDGCRKLRKKLQQWIYKGLLNKIKVLAKRKGIQVIEVNPAYTSVIGMLKYAPQYNLDKDIAGAFVIGRKALGFRERLPKNYKKLLKDREYLKFAESRLKEEKEKALTVLKQEKNKYKKRPLQKKIKEINKGLKQIQSLCSKPQTQQPVNLRKEQVRGLPLWASYKLWRVVKVALVIPVLGKSLPRDLSPLKAVVVSRDWDKVARRLVPVSWDGGYGMGKYRQLEIPIPEEADNKYSSPKCSFIHFG